MLCLLPQFSTDLNETCYTCSICHVDVHGIIFVSPAKGFQSIISRSIDCEAWPKGFRVSSQGLLIVSPAKGFQSIISRSIDCEAWPKSFRVMPLFFQNLIIFHVSLFPVTKLVLWSIQITIIDSSSCLSCCLSNVHVFSLYSSFVWHMDICMWGLRCTVRVRWAVPQGRQLLPGMSQSLWCH